MRLQLYPQLQIVYVLVWHAVTISVATGSFTSNPAHVGGVLKACVGDQISLTCRHDNSMGNGLTRWVFSSPVDCNFVIDHASVNNAQPCGPFTLQDVSETTSGMVLNSTVVVTAITSISGTVAKCRDSAGDMFNQIGSTSICVIDQPTNLTVVDGVQIFWNGTVCTGTDTTYSVVVTLVSDSQPTGDPIETTNTMTVLSDLSPNQEYTVSVSAYGSSCVSDPATVNFTSPADVSSPPGTDSDLTRTTTAQLFTGQQSTNEQKQSVGTSIGLAVGLTFVFLVLILSAVGAVVVVIVILVVMKKRLINKEEDDYTFMGENNQCDEIKEASPIKKATETDFHDSTTTCQSGVTPNESTAAEKAQDDRRNDNEKAKPTSVEDKPPPKPPRNKAAGTSTATRQSNTSEEMNPSKQESESTKSS